MHLGANFKGHCYVVYNEHVEICIFVESMKDTFSEQDFLVGFKFALTYRIVFASRRIIHMV